MRTLCVLLGICFLFTLSVQAQYTAFYQEGMDFSVSGIALKDLNSQFITIQVRVTNETIEGAEDKGKLYYTVINHADDRPCRLTKSDARVWNTRMCKSLRDNENRVVLFENPLKVLEAMEAAGWEMIAPIPEVSAFDPNNNLRDSGPGYLFKRKKT